MLKVTWFLNLYLCTSIAIQPSDLSATKKLVRLHEKFARRVLNQGEKHDEREMGIVNPSLPFNRYDNREVNGSSAILCMYGNS